MENLLAIIVIGGFLTICWVVKNIHENDDEELAREESEERKELEKKIKALNGGTDAIQDDWHKHLND